MRAATVVIVGIAAALLAPVLAAPPAQGLGVGQGAPRCAMALALPQELGALVTARGDGAPCSPEIVLLTTPLTLVEISAHAMTDIWTGTTAAPNARIEKADRLLRGVYARVKNGLERITGSDPAPQDGMAGETEGTGSNL